MENPSKGTYRAILILIVGVILGATPGAIRLDQMRREVAETTASTQKQIADLQMKLNQVVNEDGAAEQATEDRSKYRTILISKFGPVPHRDPLGVTDPWTNIDASLMPGTIWVIPGIVQPHTLNPDDRAAWAVVSPDGRVGKWLSARPAQELEEAAQ